MHPLSEFHAYLGSCYQLEQYTVKERGKWLEYAQVDDMTLRKFDARFVRDDCLRIGFGFAPDWKGITSFFAVFGNHAGVL
jgi:hypothetical protein